MFTSEPNTQMKQGKRRCTHEYDLRLSAFFGITPGIWMNLQLDHKFMRADRENGEAIRKEVQLCAAQSRSSLSRNDRIQGK